MIETALLASTTPLPDGPNPAAVYLAGLADGPGSRCVRTLNQIALMSRSRPPKPARGMSYGTATLPSFARGSPNGMHRPPPTRHCPSFVERFGPRGASG